MAEAWETAAEGVPEHDGAAGLSGIELPPAPFAEEESRRRRRLHCWARKEAIACLAG